MILIMSFRTKLTPLGGLTNPYKYDFVLFESAIPGTYTLNVKATCLLYVEIAGPGGGGGGFATKHDWTGSVGGQGSAFRGFIKFKSGKYIIIVGQGGGGGGYGARTFNGGYTGTTSNISIEIINNVVQAEQYLLIAASSGRGGIGNSGFPGDANATGGILTIPESTNIILVELQTNGATASNVSLLGNGSGQGGIPRGNQTGTNGYVKISCKKMN